MKKKLILVLIALLMFPKHVSRRSELKKDHLAVLYALLDAYIIRIGFHNSVCSIDIMMAVL